MTTNNSNLQNAPTVSNGRYYTSVFMTAAGVALPVLYAFSPTARSIIDVGSKMGMDLPGSTALISSVMGLLVLEGTRLYMGKKPHPIFTGLATAAGAGAAYLIISPIARTLG